jgi:diguanylate cyclase (GGDEF)-like protein
MIAMALIGSVACTIAANLVGGVVGAFLGFLSVVIASSVAILLWLFSNSLDEHLIRTRDTISQMRSNIAELQHEIKERSEHTLQLQMLTEVLKSITAVPDAEGLAHTLLEEVMQMFGAESGQVFFVSDDGQYLEEIASIPAKEPQQRRYLLSSQGGVVAQVALTGKSIIVPEQEGKWSDRTTHSLMCVPLTSAKGVQGVLLIEDSKRRFTQPDLRLLEFLTQQAAIALERVRLYEQLERLSLTDALTGIANRRHLEKHLELELARARRYGYPLAVVMLDIDHFKRFNDTYGHLAGDKVLQGLAKLIASEARTSDLVGRYGGEEFLIICAHTDLNGALTLAERIRKSVEEKLIISHNGKELRVTVSAGVAIFPDDATDEVSLIEAADKALYKAKQTGRNKVCVYRDVKESSI